MTSARIRPDGLIELVGRKDRQIQIHGQRIEPAEIESVLRGVDGVTDAAVAARLEGAETKLVALVAGDPSDPTLAVRVRTVVRAGLPWAMQPSRIIPVTEVPRLPGGKVDERAVLSLAEVPSSSAALTPRTIDSPVAAAIRQAVEEAWARSMGRRSLRKGLTFEEAGGDSLRLLSLIFHIEAELGRAIPLDLFHPGLRPAEFADALARWLDDTRPSSDSRPVVFLLQAGAGATSRSWFLFERAARRLCASTYSRSRGIGRNGSHRELTLNAMIALLVAQIEAAAPEGPIRVAGYSLGGALAYAVACTMIAKGRRVQFVGLLDAYFSPTNVLSAAEQTPGGYGERLRADARTVRAYGMQGAITLACRALVRRPKLLRAFAHLWRGPSTTVPGPITTGFHLEALLRTQLLFTMWKDWSAGVGIGSVLDAPVFLFRSDEMTVAGDMGWGKNCPTLSIVPLPGGHHTMFQPPHLDELTMAFVGAVLANVKAEAT